VLTLTLEEAVTAVTGLRPAYQGHRLHTLAVAVAGHTTPLVKVLAALAAVVMAATSAREAPTERSIVAVGVGVLAEVVPLAPAAQES